MATDRRDRQNTWIKAWRAGNQSALQNLINDVMPVVYQQVRFVHRHYPMIDRDDMISEGVIGIMRAAENFDTDNGSVFGAYAKRHILNQIREFAIENSAQTSVAKSRKERAAQINLAHLMTIASAHGLNDDEAIEISSSVIGIDVSHAHAILARRSGQVSQSGSTSGADDDNDGVQIASPDDDIEHIVDERAECIVDMLISEAAEVADIHPSQKARAIEISRMRHRSGEFVSYDAIAARFGVTRERIRQIDLKMQEAMRRVAELRELTLDAVLAD